MKRQLSNKKIQFLTNPQGRCLSNPVDIANKFNAFYVKLNNLKDKDPLAAPKHEDI